MRHDAKTAPLIPGKYILTRKGANKGVKGDYRGDKAIATMM